MSQDYELRASEPNEQGLCTFTIYAMPSGEEVANIDRACTLEEALQAARMFIKQLEEET
jgi:hypothetical protein